VFIGITRGLRGERRCFEGDDIRYWLVIKFIYVLSYTQVGYLIIKGCILGLEFKG
jgi:hypothetical protein